MNWNWFVAGMLFVSVVLGVVATVLPFRTPTADGLYTLAGLGLYVFGIVAAIMLVRDK